MSRRKNEGPKLTRRNICYDFENSPYFLEIPYNDLSLKFMFSSELYKSKFYDSYVENREKIKNSLSNRFGFEIENDLLSDIKLYSTIEKRGFFIWKDEEKFKCLKCIKLDGMKMMKKNLKE